MTASNPSSTNDSDPNQPDRISPWEWLAGSISGVLVASVLIFLGLQATRTTGHPPEIVLSVDSIEAVQGGWVVEFWAENRGGTTAAELQIVGSLEGGAEPEESQATIDYVPAGGRRHAGLFFTADPRGGELTLRPSGYQRP